MTKPDPSSENAELHERLEEEIEAPDADFVSVRISEFYSPKKVIFDLHLKLASGRYLRIFRAGEKYDEAELRAYERDRGVRCIYFPREYRIIYVNASATILQKVAAVPNIPVSWKFSVARILSELYMQQLFEAKDENRAALVERGREIASIISAWIQAEKGIESILLKLRDIDSSPECHGFLTGLLAALISKRFSWTTQRTSETLIFASFLCDLGLAALPPEVSRLRPKRMNTQQRRQYEEHPEISYRMLSDCGAKSLTQNVMLIVREHHECCDGLGFPNRLTGGMLLQLSKLIALSGDVIRTANEYLLPPSEAVNILFPNISESFFTDHPEIAAKYDRELLESLFSFFRKEKGEIAA